MKVDGSLIFGVATLRTCDGLHESHRPSSPFTRRKIRYVSKRLVSGPVPTIADRARNEFPFNEVEKKLTS
jgi:hypothetical protein